MMCREICNLTHTSKNKRCYVIINFNLNSKLKLLFYSSVITNNNLPLKICCENVVDVAFIIKKYI